MTARAKIVAALILPCLLAGVTVALAQSYETVPVYQSGGYLELTCPAVENCREEYSEQSGNPKYWEDLKWDGYQYYCACIYEYANSAYAADAFAALLDIPTITADTDFSFHLDSGYSCNRPDYYLIFNDDAPYKALMCSGSITACNSLCQPGGHYGDFECFEYSSFLLCGPAEPRVVYFVDSYDLTGTAVVSVSVLGVISATVMPQLNPEYFNPFPYNPNVDSPLKGVRIDFTFLARSVVTVINMVSAGGFLTWIAAFAVIFIILLALINYILRRISGGGG